MPGQSHSLLSSLSQTMNAEQAPWMAFKGSLIICQDGLTVSVGKWLEYADGKFGLESRTS